MVRAGTRRCGRGCVTVSFVMKSESARDERWMLEAVSEAERARGRTGDNPWVGCVIVNALDVVIARGHTQGPGEDHAEIVAMQKARADGVDLGAVTLYSTLEPCAFHGRTPACAHAIVAAGVRRVVTGIRDPNPRVDGAGVRILREAAIEVVEFVCEVEIARQLAPWVFSHHPHEPMRRAREWLRLLGDRAEVERRMREYYGIDATTAAHWIDRAAVG